MTLTYAIRYDRDDDGTLFGDLTPDVLELSWRIGMKRPFDTTAPVATAEITVRNPDGRYSPENASSTLQTGLTLRIWATDDNGTYIFFLGAIAHVEPTSGAYGERRAVITAECPMRSLLETWVSLDAQVNTRADEVVNAVLDRVPTRIRYLDGSFIVGLTGRAELGQNTRLPSDTAVVRRSIGIGRSTFAYVGDRWDDGVRAIDAIREVVEAERGRFFVDRDGWFILLHRHNLFDFETIKATFADDMQGVNVTYGADTINTVEVKLRPRRIGGSDDVLWRLGQAQRIRAGETKRFKVSFRGTTGERIGALNVLPPRPYTDFAANTERAGTGTDITNAIELGLVGNNGSSAQLQLRNTSSSDAYLQPGAVIRGRALYTAAPITVEERSPLSETFYGPRSMRLNLSALTSIEEAEDIARFELFRRSAPRGMAQALHLQGSQHLPQILARRLYDRITVTESQSSHSSDYFIIGVQHRVVNGGVNHSVTYTLEPVNLAGFWQLAFGKLGKSTRLAY